MGFMDSIKKKAEEAKVAIASKVEEVATSDETKAAVGKAKTFLKNSLEEAKVGKVPRTGYVVFDSEHKFVKKSEEDLFEKEGVLCDKATEEVKLSKGFAQVYRCDKQIATIKYEDVVCKEIAGDYEIGKKPNETEYAIYRYVGFDKEIIIPSVIDDKKIIKIAKNAFSENATITKVEISDGIDFLGDKCFYGCDNLTDVILHSIKEIGSGCFEDCYVLTSVILPDSLETLEYQAFKNSGITKIVLPDSIKEIHSNCFEDCDDLEYAKLPENLEVIPREIFKGCGNLETVEFPQNVIEIKESSFDGCCSLKIDEIPSTVKHIERFAFHDCAIYIDELRLPDGIESIGNFALSGFHPDKLYIPSSVKYIGERIIDDFIDEVYIEDGCTIGKNGGYYGKLDLWVTKKYYVPKSIAEIEMEPQGYIGFEFDSKGNPTPADDYREQINIVKTKIALETVNLIIYCEPGSAAQEYAQKNEVKMEKWDFNK